MSSQNKRNFLFTGSVRGGERLAVAYTLVDNCIILGIDPHVYLVDVITTLESKTPVHWQCGGRIYCG